MKFWKSMSFWSKAKIILIGLGIGGEITLFMSDLWHGWKIVAGAATLLAYFITHMIEDKDNNGLADLFEKKKK